MGRGCLLTRFQGHSTEKLKNNCFVAENAAQLKTVVTKISLFNMENGQPNRLLKWKRTGKTLGITFGITFMIYFAALSYLMGAKLILPVLVTVLNLVATGTWLYGLAKNKTGFMMASLLSWGIPLNVMIGLIFYFILQKPLFREIVPIYSVHEIVAFAVTAHFVLFYFVLIMSYRSIRFHGRRIENSFDWKIVGFAVGWLVLAFSIGLTTFFMYLSVIYEAPITLLVTCLVFVMNLTNIGFWLWGIAKNKTALMLMSLIFWTIALSLWFAVIIYVIYDGMSKDQMLYEYRDNHLYALTVFCIALYLVAVWSYKSIKRDIRRASWETQRFDVAYAGMKE